VLLEFGSVEVLVAHLALDHHLWALLLNMLEKLSTGHVLEIFVVTNVAAKLGAVVDGVVLQVLHGLPDESSLPVLLKASMGELTEVNTILKDVIDVFQEIRCMAVGAVYL